MDANSLNSNDVFVLKLPHNAGYTWIGKGASPAEERGAEHVAGVLQCRTTRIREGEEPGVCCGAGATHPNLHLVGLLTMQLTFSITSDLVKVTGGGGPVRTH